MASININEINAIIEMDEYYGRLRVWVEYMHGWGGIHGCLVILCGRLQLRITTIYLLIVTNYYRKM